MPCASEPSSYFTSCFQSPKSVCLLFKCSSGRSFYPGVAVMMWQRVSQSLQLRLKNNSCFHSFELLYIQPVAWWFSENEHTLQAAQFPAVVRQASPVCFSTKKSYFWKSLHVSGCSRLLALADGHEHCLMCLGIKHTEAAFMDDWCFHCGKITISVLRSWLQQPLTLTQSSSSSGQANSLGELSITVRASPPGDESHCLRSGSDDVNNCCPGAQS